MRLHLHKLLKFRLHILMALSAIPTTLVGVCPSLNLDRSIASVPQIRNWGIESINAKEAWRIEEGSRDVVVAVIDTGIDPEHPDLKPNLWHDRETGIFGWDFTKDKPNPLDDHSHGTHVAGIIGATLNAKSGTSGVVHKVSIMPVKYYSEKASGAENLRNSVRALNWAVDHGAHIINYSGGGPEFSMEEYTALRRAREKNILLIVAAGNEHSNGDLSENFYYPCAYKLDNIICVAATNVRNELLGSSNWGKVTVDVAAPGENILSTVPGGKYAYMSGSSQATGFVTSIATMLKSKNPDLKPQAIKSIIRAAVDKVDALSDKVFAGGKVNALLALSTLDRQTAPAGSSMATIAESAPQVREAKRVTAGKNPSKSLAKNSIKQKVALQKSASVDKRKGLKISNL